MLDVISEGISAFMSVDLSEMSAHRSETMGWSLQHGPCRKYTKNNGFHTGHAENTKPTTVFSIGADQAKNTRKTFVSVQATQEIQ